MPVIVEYTKDGIGVILYHEGLVTGGELLNSIYSVYKSKKYLTLKYWVGDRTRCTDFRVDSNYAELIAKLNKRESLRNPDMLLALVAPKDIDFAMLRLYEIYAEGTFKTAILKSRDAAEEWISHEPA